jgi:hypothetical protein
MKWTLLFLAIPILLFSALFAIADVEFNEEVRDEVVGLFGVLLTPSIFTPASSEDAGLLMYGRTLTDEGKVPDFDGDIEDEIDELAIFAGGRIRGVGLTLGFGEDSEFEFSQPFIASIDYKASLMKENPNLDAAVDIQYSMIVLTEEEEINVSATGFGVVTVSGILSARLFSVLEPYIGLAIHYVYLNSEEEDIRVLKPIPRAGLQIILFSPLVVGTEVKFINNENLESAWMWDVGVGFRF